MIYDQKFLFQLLAQPTAPFRESHVIRTLVDYLDKAKVPYFCDPIGNIIVGAKSKKEYLKKVRRKTKEPLRLFVAHTDHPGFHGVVWKNSKLLKVKWFGGSPQKFLEGASVDLCTISGVVASGKLHEVRMNKNRTAIDTAIVRLKKDISDLERDPQGIFGSFQFRKPVWQKDDLIFTKAADDLVGSFAITMLGRMLQKKGEDFLGLLTRAEEVGFIGAIGHFELGWLEKPARPLLCVSLETSRTLSGAQIGKGPVVRLGDRATVFDTHALQLFTELAEKVLPGEYQRRIMDGGTCEATAATAYGIPSIGISIPLGNYHNQSLQGGPDSRGKNGPAPEFVHEKDIKRLLLLCEALMQRNLGWDEAFRKKRQSLHQHYKSYEKYLPLS